MKDELLENAEEACRKAVAQRDMLAEAGQAVIDACGNFADLIDARNKMKEALSKLKGDA